ncbi:TIGR03086 family metal-binding protein [Nocardia sp. alder85J]|uniref:TIGR03086 family metal-binding protein n=1 Tax=Nocardia sp. alder85J TaxID=2862949 RepID=UPI001CD384DE|nr:TIGR03086 family metal-binding protein [Nocardia sp. alder85J]MCX4097429.1 TIGR03086 family metal-binding protein [Nocardia sp. alder85J]
MGMADIRELNRLAVDHSVTLVSRVTAADLGRATPCSGWNLADLLSHMIVQHHGFAASARGQGADPAIWAPQPLSDDPVAEYAEAAADVTAAYAESGVLERYFDLPEFAPGFRAPGSLAIGFHFIDYVVHGWDVARTLGLDYRLDDTLAEPALGIATAVPDGTERLQPGAAFAPSLSSPTTDPLERILTLLGRSPGWPH